MTVKVLQMSRSSDIVDADSSVTTVEDVHPECNAGGCAVPKRKDAPSWRGEPDRQVQDMPFARLIARGFLSLRFGQAWRAKAAKMGVGAASRRAATRSQILGKWAVNCGDCCVVGRFGQTVVFQPSCPIGQPLESCRVYTARQPRRIARCTSNTAAQSISEPCPCARAREAFGTYCTALHVQASPRCPHWYRTAAMSRQGRWFASIAPCSRTVGRC